LLLEKQADQILNNRWLLEASREMSSRLAILALTAIGW
jgi:hypothetical protein